MIINLQEFDKSQYATQFPGAALVPESQRTIRSRVELRFITLGLGSVIVSTKKAAATSSESQADSRKFGSAQPSTIKLPTEVLSGCRAQAATGTASE